MKSPVLEIHQLIAGYRAGKKPCAIVQDFSTTLTAGEFVCLIGPNGAGKSTLLRTLAGMQPPLGGSIRLMGQDIDRMRLQERARRLSVVLTQKVETGFLTGYDLVAVGRTPYTGWMGQLGPVDHEAIQLAIRQVGAQNLADRAFNTMSDGERQKVLIARALAQEPDLMLLDEPTAFLDLPRRIECMALLRDLAHQTGRAILLSTHDLDLALRYADRIWLLPYDGSVQVGTPEDLVLSGAFQTTFENMGVEFDLDSGTFRPPTRTRTAVSLDGQGVVAYWTQRALERAGFAVQPEATEGLRTVRVITDGSHSHWVINGDDERHVCRSIDELMHRLRP
jgi:iron complex transport system ATP-binding protein